MADSDARRWILCPECRYVCPGRRAGHETGVCPSCGTHLSLTAPERLRQLLDEGSVMPLPRPRVVEDPLGFTDTLPYPERLRRARAATGLEEACLAALGRIGGAPVAVAVLDFRFLGGSLGTAVGETVTRAAETALERRIPLILVSASGGARMQEGPLSLMQMAKTVQAVTDLNRAGVLTVSVATDPTYGGVAASFATICDVIIAEPGARMGFTGPRVIEQTLGAPMPEGLQNAESLLEHGLIDAVRPRSALRPTIRSLLAARPGQRTPRPLPEGVLVRTADGLDHRDPAQLPARARETARPTTLDYARLMLSDFEELHGDRFSGDCPAIVGGIGTLEGTPLMLVGHQRGHTAAELAARDYGMASPDGYRKAVRLMRLAAKLGIPLVALVDTPGAHPGPESERGGQSHAIAASLATMADLPTPTVAVIVGEGGSGGALALAMADTVLMLENAVYSVMSPEGCASILWKDSSYAAEAARNLALSPSALLEIGAVDGVIREPESGAESDHRETARALSAVLAHTLDRLSTLRTPDLLELRHRRYRAFGTRDTRPSAKETTV